MKNLIKSATLFIALSISLLACSQETKKQFDQTSLDEVMLSISKEEIKFSEILKKHKSQIIVLDIWASWCKDCIKSIPEVVELQKQNNDVVFVFISMDKNYDSWINGINKYKLEGEHYLVTEGMKGKFGKSINLDWIPRYIVIDQNGNIAQYKSIEANDPKIQNTINQLKTKK